MKLPVGRPRSSARAIVSALREEARAAHVGFVLVSGMLAEQLAPRAGAGRAAGAVVVGDVARLAGAEVAVHVVAGDPSEDDDALVRRRDRQGVPVVLVQLWPQADWTPPFVLTPFVVECRAGEGFPVPEIADRIVAAREDSVHSPAGFPCSWRRPSSGAVGTQSLRAALDGALGRALGGSRPLLVLEQIRMLAARRVSLRRRRIPERARRPRSRGPLAGIAAATGCRQLRRLRASARRAARYSPHAARQRRDGGCGHLGARRRLPSARSQRAASFRRLAGSVRARS